MTSVLCDICGRTVKKRYGDSKQDYMIQSYISIPRYLNQQMDGSITELDFDPAIVICGVCMDRMKKVKEEAYYENP